MLINPKNRAIRRLHGFSLVEVLIALVIMSVGMLGIAGLYVHSMQAGRTSMFRHQAVTLAGDVADRIRSNPRAGVVYAGTGAAFGCVSGVVDCDEGEMAQHDIFLWQQQAADSLPAGTVTVNFDDAFTPPLYTITITWSEPGVTPDPNYSVAIPVVPN